MMQLALYLGIVVAFARAADSPVAFFDATVIPMNGSTPLLVHQTVIVRAGKISAIGSSSEIPITDIEMRVNASGKFLIPGLTDMHVHLQDDISETVNKAILTLSLAHGVTTVRNMFGLPDHLILRERIAKGSLLGPRIITTGPAIDGRPTLLPRSLAVTTAEQAVNAARRQKEMGFDALKVYNSLDKTSYLALLAQAKAERMPVFGHVPVSVGLEGAIAAGQASIEHLDGYVDAIESDDSPYRFRHDWESRALAYGFVDPVKLAHIVKVTRDAGVWNCPTLVVAEKWLPMRELAALVKSPQMAFVPRAILREWEHTAVQPAVDRDVLRRAQIQRRAIVLALHRAGAGLLVGTDTPSPAVVPGTSLIEEIQELVTAGLTPLEGISAATSEPARFLQKSAEFGSIAPGLAADLLLLDANPLEDVANLKRINGVMAAGHWMPKDRIDSMLAELVH